MHGGWSEDDFDSDSYERYTDHTGPHFKDDIAVYIRKRGKKCCFSDLKPQTVDYRFLDSDQLSYYLYWRDQFWSGKMMMTCEGYIWLLAHEILYGKPDPVVTQGLLLKLWEEGRTELYDPTVFVEFIRDYSILNNLPVPTDEVFACKTNEIVVNNITQCPDITIPDSVFHIFGIPNRIIRSCSGRFNGLMNGSLRTVYRKFREEGRDLFAEYCDARNESVRCLFSGLRLCTDTTVAVDLPNACDSLRFRNLMCGIADYIAYLIGELKIPSTKISLPEDIKQTVRDVYYGTSKTDIGYDREDTVASVTEVERWYIARNNYIPRRAPSAKDCGGGVLFHSIADKCYRYFHDMGVFESQWTLRSDDPVPYVPSIYMNVDYRQMSKRQKQYYVYWRTQAMNGFFLETDTGYLRLLTAEIISFMEDPKQALGLMNRLKEAYGGPAERVLDDTIKRYSLVNGLETNVTVEDEGFISCCAYRCLSGNPIQEMAPQVISFIIGRKNAENIRLDGITCRAFNRSLQLIDSARRDLGIKGMLKFYNVTVYDINVFPDLDMDYGIPKEKGTLSGIFVKQKSDFHLFITQTLKLIELYRKKAEGKKVKIPLPSMHGERTLRIIERCVLDEIEEEIKRERERNRIVLDREAVDAAEKDLRTVTEMISSESGEEEEVPQETPAVPETAEEETKEEGTAADSVWSAFISKLDGLQKEYLIAAAEGNGDTASIARNAKTTVSAMEDSINGIAVDIVGDTVLENGGIVEDYAYDIRAALSPPD